MRQEVSTSGLAILDGATLPTKHGHAGSAAAPRAAVIREYQSDSSSKKPQGRSCSSLKHREGVQRHTRCEYQALTEVTPYQPGAVTHPGPSPDPDKEIATIRLLRWCDSWLRTPDSNRDPRHGERKVAKQVRESLPRETLALAPTAEPLVPRSLRVLDDEQQASKVAAHTEVVEVALDSPRERGVLVFHREVPMATVQPAT